MHNLKHSIIIITRNYVIVITWVEDIMADNSPSPRTSAIIAIISEVTGYNYFISYLPIP